MAVLSQSYTVRCLSTAQMMPQMKWTYRLSLSDPLPHKELLQSTVKGYVIFSVKVNIISCACWHVQSFTISSKFWMPQI